MSNEKINKYLTETMGECWHDRMFAGPPAYKCNKCGANEPSTAEIRDFFTWEGYGKLKEFHDSWDKAKLGDFLAYILQPVLAIKPNDDELNDFCIIRCLQVFHKDKLALLIYEFLKENK